MDLQRMSLVLASSMRYSMRIKVAMLALGKVNSLGLGSGQGDA